MLTLFKSWSNALIPRSFRIEQGVRTCLAFHVSGMLFGVDARAMQKIARYQILASPRGMPACICGLYRHQGLMIPVLDLSRRFGHAPITPGGRTCILIVEMGLGKWRKEIGLLADDVRGLSEFSLHALKPMPDVGHHMAEIEGLVREGKDFLIVLDHLVLLNDHESACVADFIRQL